MRDIVDLVWETLRLRRLKVSYLRSCEWVGVEACFMPWWAMTRRRSWPGSGHRGALVSRDRSAIRPTRRSGSVGIPTTSARETPCRN